MTATTAATTTAHNDALSPAAGQHAAAGVTAATTAVSKAGRRRASQAAAHKATTEPVRYVLYARKSSEDDERQALSIESQVKAMQLLAEREGLAVAEVYRESHSAKTSGLRPVFQQMVVDLRAGKFTGIITWAPDRLSRNAGDLGAIVDLMDTGCIVDIRTHGQRFTNSPNEKFLLMILGSQAKLENDHRGENVKRGMKTRCELGRRPCPAPLGYSTARHYDPSKSQIHTDAERAPVVREMFLRCAEGWSGRRILAWLEEVGFRSRSGKLVSLSMVYNILKNPFYTGRFQYPRGSGEWYDGVHEPLVTREVFDQVQEQLVTAPKGPWGQKEFAFGRMLRCGACGSGVTAEEKWKFSVTGLHSRYVYYGCSRGRKRQCPERYITERELMRQLEEIIDTVPLEMIGGQERIQQEVKRYKKFRVGVLGEASVEGGVAADDVDVRRYATYVLREGTREERKEVLSLLLNGLRITGGNVVLNEEKLPAEREFEEVDKEKGVLRGYGRLQESL